MPRICLALHLAALVIAPASAQPPTAVDRTPLDDYLQRPDPTYAWKVAKTVEGNPAKTTILHLTSQTWRTAKEVDKPTWEHWLIVVKPEKVTSKKAFLLIGGGANDRPMPTGPDVMTSLVAHATGSIVAELRMVPNQPLVFHGDGKPRKEDDLIGYAWDQYLKTGDATWLPRLPMVKSAVRAMDCLQEWSKQEGVPVERFVVAGGSKRGWTTWLTGATDKRVEAIIPIVIDVANVDASMRHHAAVYGFWARAIGDYFHHGIMQRSNDPRVRDLYQIVDPLAYRGRLTLPKYVVNASGDQFFVPDSSQFYYDELKGEKLLRYVPNADHSLRGSDALESIIGYYQMILAGKPRPQYSWTFEKDGTIRVKSATPVKRVQLWQATNPKTRDFRVDTIGKAFTSVELKPEADGTYAARLKAPEQGWTASFVELTYETGGTHPLKVSTAVRVLPDRLPFADLDLKKVPYEGVRAKPAGTKAP